MYYVYMLTNQTHQVLYIGVTNDLNRRLNEHRLGAVPGFTQKYRVHYLVYYEQTTDVKAALAREKQLKGWNRAKKNALIAGLNPSWRELSEDWMR